MSKYFLFKKGNKTKTYIRHKNQRDQVIEKIIFIIID